MASVSTKKSDEYYMRKIEEIILSSGVDYPGTPTKLLDYLYIGSYRDAENPEFLTRLGISYVLNCAAYRGGDVTGPYNPEDGILAYKQFDASDDDKYNMAQHIGAAKSFIDSVKRSGGKVLVHCAMGINRSGFICAAYMMLDQRLDLLESVHRMKRRRGTVLCNRNFQRQLVQFARQNNML